MGTFCFDQYDHPLLWCDEKKRFVERQNADDSLRQWRQKKAEESCRKDQDKREVRSFSKLCYCLIAPSHATKKIGFEFITFSLMVKLLKIEKVLKHFLDKNNFLVAGQTFLSEMTVCLVFPEFPISIKDLKNQGTLSECIFIKGNIFEISLLCNFHGKILPVVFSMVINNR